MKNKKIKFTVFLLNGSEMFCKLLCEMAKRIVDCIEELTSLSVNLYYGRQ